MRFHSSSHTTGAYRRLMARSGASTKPLWISLKTKSRKSFRGRKCPVKLFSNTRCRSMYSNRAKWKRTFLSSQTPTTSTNQMMIKTPPRLKGTPRLKLSTKMHSKRPHTWRKQSSVRCGVVVLSQPSLKNWSRTIKSNLISNVRLNLKSTLVAVATLIVWNTWREIDPRSTVKGSN